MRSSMQEAYNEASPELNLESPIIAQSPFVSSWANEHYTSNPADRSLFSATGARASFLSQSRRKELSRNDSANSYTKLIMPQAEPA